MYGIKFIGGSNMETKILFQTNDETLQQFIKGHPNAFAITIANGKQIVLVKEVKENKQTYEEVRSLAGTIAREVQKREIETVQVDAKELTEAFTTLDENKVIVAFTEGWHLGAYAFDSYKTKKVNTIPTLQFSNADEALITKGEVRAFAMGLSRDLTNEIPSVLNPESFPTILQDTFADTDVEVIVHDKAKLEAMEMNGLLAVNRGSKFDPAFIELHYKGDETKPLIALVGKGVTFDTGGISLKNSRDLSDMRMDMGGAAAVAGAIQLLAASGAKVNVVGLIQTVENMPDKHSILPGDIITYKTGQTVQVGNTDAEGRLILADGLIRAGELNADYIVDIATLTGAVMAALGTKVAGIFGEDDLLQTMKAIGDENGDFVWPMPLVDAYDKMLDSDYADFRNISHSPYGGSITAALFLRRFVPENSKWIHVDMAGTMDTKQEGYYASGATGFGARLLADYAEKISE